MAETNWIALTGSLAIGSVDRGVVRAGQAASPPPGGGSFCYGFNSLGNSEGVVAFHNTQLNFAPMVKGGSIRGAIKRGTSGGNTDFAPFFFLGAQGNSVNDKAYMLGLSDADPHKIILKKGVMSTGLNPAGTGILRESTEEFNIGWQHHLRLDAIVNDNGDVVLWCFYNDVTINDVTSPDWQAIPGMGVYIDDALQINTGENPYVGGYAGYGMYTKNVTRRSFVDHIEIWRQT